MHPIDLSIADHLFFLIAGLVIPVMSAMSAPIQLKLMDFDYHSKKSVYFSNSMMLWLGAAIVLGIWYFQGRPIATLGFTMPSSDAPQMWFTLFLLFALFYVYDTTSQLTTSEKRQKVWLKWQDNIPFMPVNQREMLPYTFMAITAGICEEIMFRGFLIQYLIALIGPTRIGITLAITIPAVVFSIAHRYQGWKAVMKIVLMAVLFGYFYIYTQSLWIPIMLHIIVDMVAGLIGVYVFGEDMEGGG